MNTRLRHAARAARILFLVPGLLGASGCFDIDGLAAGWATIDFSVPPDLAVVTVCNNGKKEGTETDVDCGGGKCSPCADGKVCMLPRDCTSGICMQGLCRSPSCADGVKNGLETDVDCGGACAKCDDGKQCKQPADCKNAVCTGFSCRAPSCSDVVKNGKETDVDCGGGTCPGCDPGRACLQNSDCASAMCTPGSNTCATPPSCFDNTRNGKETDVDCGGPNCGGCSDGKQCNVAGDCAHQNCLGGVCLPQPSCGDGLKNGKETDVDCGGPTCPKCAKNRACLSNSDCASSICQMNVCG